MTDQISASQLYRALSRGEVPEILDLRNSEDASAAPVEGPRPVRVNNIALWHVLDDPAGRAAQIADGAVAVCAHGNGAEMIAEELAAVGRRVIPLTGGMLAWSQLLVPHPLPLGDGPLRAWQVLRPAKGCLSYVIGVPGQHCLVVDPARHTEVYRELAEANRMRITHVVDTHLHADHISGGPLLATQEGAVYGLPVDDAPDVAWPVQPLRDGERIRLGEKEHVEIMGLHLPGHTPGTTAVVVPDVLVAAGDTVFVRGVGRPDLTGQAAQLARALYDSVRTRLASMAPQTWLLPAHWSSADEIGADGTVRATIGDVLSGDLLAGLDPDAFVAEVLRSLPAAPSSYERIRAVNTGAPAGDEERLTLEVGRNQCAAAGTTARPA